MSLKKSPKRYHKGTILQVLPELITGGVERGTVDISKELVKDGFNSIVASSGGPMVSLIVNNNGKHFTLPLKSKNPITIFNNIRKLEKIIINENVDLIHARSRAPAWSTYFAAKRTKKPMITTFHGYYKFSNKIKKWYNSIMTKGIMVIAVSEFIKNHILENYNIPVDQIEVIHRGVDLVSFDPETVFYQRMTKLAQKYNIPDNKTIILMPGRISKWKGQDIMIEAMAKLPKDKYHCLLVGDYAKRLKFHSKLIQLISDLNLIDNVTFTGDISDMSAIYKLSDIVVSASKEPEAFGRITIEGQAMCKIVIASDIGGSKETIKNGKTGFLFKSGDANDLADKILEVSALNPKALLKIGTDAREHIKQNFSLAKMRSKTLKLYSEIIGLTR